jgi:hypothetical protein
VKFLSFHNSSFALRYFFNVNGKATICVTQPLFRIEPEFFHKTKEPLNTSLNQHFSIFGEFLPLGDQKNYPL